MEMELWRCSVLACHPVVVPTLKQHFWWSTMQQDVSTFVAACDTSIRNKTNNQPATGLLRPLPVPHHPLPRIAVEFVTGLPASNGDTYILTIADQLILYLSLISRLLRRLLNS